MTTERKRVILLSKRVTTEEDNSSEFPLLEFKQNVMKKYQNVTVINVEDKRINGQKTKIKDVVSHTEGGNQRILLEQNKLCNT